MKFEDLEEGVYVRNYSGGIAQIKIIREGKSKYAIMLEATMSYWGNEIYATEDFLKIIKSHGKSIIDVIEVGDIVNGNTVDRVNKTNLHTTAYDCLIAKDIETVLTKEQYERQCYCVERR